MASSIGVIGLAVMGENLILNMESRGYGVACYNRSTNKVEHFVEGRAQGKNITGCYSLEELCLSLKSPRKIMLMIKAGQPVDSVINDLKPLLDEGDIIIDGGNSWFEDTDRRVSELKAVGIHYVGAGVSGGEEGALTGPSIMPGGCADAWPFIKDIFQSIAAKADDGRPCCEWVGSGGSGHYVKMVHNGIEYGDMQLLSEVYHLMSEGLKLGNKKMSSIFAEWNRGELDSYLIEITAKILAKLDEETGKPVLDTILDAAGQKGTGKWTSQSALDLGVPIPQIAQAVFARFLSALKDERVAAADILAGPEPVVVAEPNTVIADLQQALFAAKICSYAQGFQLLSAASKEYGWKLNFGEIALMWRGGCIIRARFLDDIKSAFETESELANIMLAPYFRKVLATAQQPWRSIVKLATDMGIPIPAMSTALNYYDSYRCARLPANLLQAQRDFFGAHTYERVDRPRGEFFHTNWTGRGGDTSSTQYSV